MNDSNHLKIVKLLLERDADGHVLNDEGETPYRASLATGYGAIAYLVNPDSVARADSLGNATVMV